MVDRFPDAVQRVSGAPLIRDRLKRGVVTIPGRQCSIALLHTALRPGKVSARRESALEA